MAAGQSMAQQEVQQLQQQLTALQHAVGSADQLQQDKITLQVSLLESAKALPVGPLQATLDCHLLPDSYLWHAHSASPDPAAHGLSAHGMHAIAAGRVGRPLP